MKNLLILFATISLALTGCGDDDSDSSGGGTAGNGPSNSVSGCETSSDCPDGHACIQVGAGPAGCVPTCSLSANECSGSAECAGVGVLEVSVCQPEPEPEDPPTPETQPKIPCRVDADCAAAHPTAICAEWRGARDCTIPCMNEETCDPPAIGGVTMDFLSCSDDERSDKDRTACLPREECFNDPFSCISGFPGIGGGGEGGIPEDLPGF